MVIKISFLFKNPKDEQENLRYITITDPRIDKAEKFAWGNRYVCEIYLSNIKQTLPYYGINPIDTLFQATEMVKGYLQGLVKNGYTISEVEGKKPWKLEKLSDNYLQNKVEAVKNNPNISQEDKDKILAIVKESFSKSVIKDQLDKLIE